MADKDYLGGVSTVLVVDRDEVVQRMIRERFAVRGATVISAETADEALSVLEQRADSDDPVQIILTELSLLGSTGYDLIKRVRSHAREEISGTPAIILSSRKRSEQIVDGFRAGADDYVAKPWDFPELEARIGLHHRKGAARTGSGAPSAGA